MKTNVWALALIGLANASAVIPRDAPADYAPVKDYPQKDYPSKGYPPKDPPHNDYPPKDPPKGYPQQGYPQKGYPQKDYPQKDYPQKDWPKQSYPSKSYPPKPNPSKSYPANSYKNEDYDNHGPYDSHGKSRDSDYPDKSNYYPGQGPKKGGYNYKGKGGQVSTWKPKSRDPQFFNLRIDDQCTIDPTTQIAEPAVNCPFNGYAIRLEGGNFIATPYNKFADPKLATFFVDDDTSLYTVSKEPLQVYIDSVTGALKYSKIGWLPSSAISKNFFHTGSNPLGLIDPSPSYLSWPSTIGGSFAGSPFILCPIGGTLQYQVFINNENFGVGGPAGVLKDGCVVEDLAAVNANPWA